jgi:predicted phage tail protein
MTTIVLHGLLAQKFGKKIKIHLGRLCDFAVALDTVKQGFREFILKLNKQNQGYSMVLENNGKEIHLIPSIGGSGRTLLMIVAIVLIVVACIVAWYLAPLLAKGAGGMLGIFGWNGFDGWIRCWFKYSCSCYRNCISSWR